MATKAPTFRAHQQRTAKPPRPKQPRDHAEIRAGTMGRSHDRGAWGAELIVVATRGKTGLRRVLLGSVAERVVRDAASSVLVVRHD